jgi:ABC-type glycerol-3-phosphate transport system permease component
MKPTIKPPTAAKRPWYKRRKTIWVYVLLCIAVLVTVFPIFWIVLTSLKTSQETVKIPIVWMPEKPSLQAYFTVWKERNLVRYFTNTIIVAVGATTLSIFLATIAGYGFSRFRFRLNQPLFILVLMATMFPAVLLVVPYFLMLNRLGLIDTHLSFIWAYTSFSLPFCTWMMKGFFDTIPKEIDEAALVDGCNRFSAFWYSILPLAAPGAAATAVFSFLLAWNHYVFALALTTDSSMYMLSVGIASLQEEYWTDYPQVMASAVMAIAPVVVLYSFLEKYLVRGISAGAVKG